MKAVLTVALLGLIGVAALPAFSDSDNSATITRDAGCLVYDGDGVLQLASGDMTVQTHGGQTTLTCKATGLANSTGSAVRWQDGDAGKGCNTFAGPSDHWSDTVSASGNVTLVCHVSN
jgi:hypothetical protein